MWILNKYNAIKTISTNKTVQNAKWMIFEQVIQMAISVVLSVITTRYLGQVNYGIINYCAAYVAFFTSVCTLGLEGVIVKELVNHREQEGIILGTGIVMRVLASVVSMVSILAILVVVRDSDPIVLRVAFLQSLVLVFRAFDLIDFWFQSKLQSKNIAIIKTIAYICVAFYKVYILIANKTIEWFAFSTTFDFFLIAIMSYFAYKRAGGKVFSCSTDVAKRLIKQSYHFILSGIIVTVYTQMDKIMIGEMLGDAEVGLYSIATTMCNYWVLIPTALINSARPSIMQRKKDGDEVIYQKRLRQLYAILIWIGIVVSTLISIVSPYIIKLLYSNEFVEAAPALSIAIWYTTFSVLGTARGIWILCEEKNEYVKKYVFWGAVLNCVLNFALIPVMGINGAAFATLITQFFTCVFAPMLYKETKSHTKLLVDAFLLIDIR